ncbi:hypothetical protein ABTY20_18655 [Streptomyces sp. NPDC126497]|uniref:hypothetical protein n=1 Tax=Streptomyces sp. NPDC126497 TaxID=3155313 RepID=UPI0033229150
MLSPAGSPTERCAHLVARGRIKPKPVTAAGTPGFVETVRTLDLMGRFPKVVADLDARITEILLAREARDAAALLVGRPRTLDAMHVASALSLRDALTAVVTYDRRDARDRSRRRAAGSRTGYRRLTEAANCRNPTGGHGSHCGCPNVRGGDGTDRFWG